jgi:ribonucleoside-diphosphate reductase alpha chain
MKQELMRNNGSVQDLDIPQDLKELYKTVWEMSMKDIIDMSRHRGYFVDQSIIELVYAKCHYKININAFYLD